MHRHRNSIKPSRGQVLFIVLIGLPIFAYITASIAFVYVNLDFRDEILIRSIAPFFDRFYLAIVEKFDVRMGHRFLIVTFALTISFLFQVIFLAILAIVDHRNRLKMAGFTPIAFFACAVVGAMLVSLYYFPNSYLNIDNRSARAFLSTDLKYFYVAAVLGFNSITPYVFLRLLASWISRH